VDFVESFVSIGNHLDKAQQDYSTGLTRLQSRVLTQAKRLEQLGAKSTKDLPASVGLLEN
jgi:DNA anti-recombination protein RmuC